MSRERGGAFRRAYRFYRSNVRAVILLSGTFYLALAALSALVFLTLGWSGLLVIIYFGVASIFWLQAPLAKLVDDVRSGRDWPGVRRTFEAVYPRMGAVTTASLLATIVVYIGLYLLIFPGLFLLARFSLIIPVIVLEGAGVLHSFGRSQRLVRGHTARVVGEIIVSTMLLVVVWYAAILVGAVVPFVGLVLTLAVVAVATPVIPLMRTLTYFEFRGTEPREVPAV